jgi:hypothetical protein
MKMLAELAKPPREMTFFERWFTSNQFLLGTQLFNISVLPYLLKGLVMIVQHPSDEAGYDLVFGILFLLPILALWTVSAMDHNMRLNRGYGSTFAWDACLRSCVRGLRRDEVYWQTHIGTDGLFSLWLFGVLMVAFTLPLPLMIAMEPANTDNWWYLGMLLPFTVGFLLMLRGAYPDNFNSNLCDGRRDAEDENEMQI